MVTALLSKGRNRGCTPLCTSPARLYGLSSPSLRQNATQEALVHCDRLVAAHAALHAEATLVAQGRQDAVTHALTALAAAAASPTPSALSTQSSTSSIPSLAWSSSIARLHVSGAPAAVPTASTATATSPNAPPQAPESARAAIAAAAASQPDTLVGPPPVTLTSALASPAPEPGSEGAADSKATPRPLPAKRRTPRRHPIKMPPPPPPPPPPPTSRARTRQAKAAAAANHAEEVTALLADTPRREAVAAAAASTEETPTHKGSDDETSCSPAASSASQPLLARSESATLGSPGAALTRSLQTLMTPSPYPTASERKGPPPAPVVPASLVEAMAAAREESVDPAERAARLEKVRTHVAARPATAWILHHFACMRAYVRLRLRRHSGSRVNDARSWRCAPQSCSLGRCAL